MAPVSLQNSMHFSTFHTLTDCFDLMYYISLPFNCIRCGRFLNNDKTVRQRYAIAVRLVS